MSKWKLGAYIPMFVVGWETGNLWLSKPVNVPLVIGCMIGWGICSVMYFRSVIGK